MNDDDLRDRLDTLLRYAPASTLMGALEIIDRQDAKRPECRCAIEFPIGSCPAHPWRGTFVADKGRA